MHEQRLTRQQRLAREKAVYRYMTALDSGDVDTIAAILHEAERDPALQQMILEVQDFYQNEDSIIITSDEILHAQVRMSAFLPLQAVAGQQSEPVLLRHFRSRNRFRSLTQIFAAILIMGILLGGFFMILAFYHAAPASHPSALAWRVNSNSSTELPQNQLNGLAVVSANDAWAVGYSSNGANNNYIGRTLIEHWDGTRWNIMPGVNSQTDDSFSGVAAISANDVWAVGYADNHTLIEHWNGIRWSVVPSPSSGADYNNLSAVAAVSSTNIWAIGVSSNKTIPTSSATIHQIALEQTLIEHWDGSRWSIVKSPNPAATQNYLNGIAVISASDIWAVGGITNYIPPYTFTHQALIEHWDGSKWSAIASPEFDYASLSGVAAVSANNVWAVGIVGYVVSGGQENQGLIEHWNGSKWSAVTSPDNPDATSNILSGITAVSANDIWAVGSAPRAYPLQGQTLIEHWNGTRWSMVSSPNPGSYNNFLIGVAGVPHTNEVWAIGYSGEGYTPERTIIEVYST